ncbi:MAG TPA: tRNA (N(6)-L-threonylcarbamoyladenosine(37)-C(2))-methylthiotransferase MtaB [Clostridia bacterium]|nr:tRNA (N(6)-L-threonylcarbamoyladenosine(37)-C(2))-methylthiotransferase MtaB [Clostridia bacterium]
MNRTFIDGDDTDHRVAFHTLGCKVNQYDTQAMQEKFIQNGYEIVEFSNNADVYVINTCTVTSLGDKKSRQMIRRANRLNPDAVIAVVGCYAQTAPDEILGISGVNLILGTEDRNRIVEFTERVQKTGIPINGVHDIMKVVEFEEMPITSYEEKTRAVLKVQEGCNRYCSYCIIPYARGPIRSRKLDDVLKQVKKLVGQGFQEFVLTGIHVASYGKDLEGVDLLTLIQHIARIEGVKRIRLGSLEPTLLTEEFVVAIGDIPKVCRHYHLSLQSGNDSTLKRMNRRYTSSEYGEIVNRLRKHIPDVAITTDIMVGFPGETEEEFQGTMDFVSSIGFSRIHVFKYSPREGTPAATYRDQVSGDLKETRSKELIDLGHKMESSYLKSFIGKKMNVLLEEESRDGHDWYEGYSDHYIRVIAQGDNNLIGQIITVLIEEQLNNKLKGTIIKY